jgi:hypothetical protein
MHNNAPCAAVNVLRSSTVKPTLLIFSFCGALFFSACRPAAVTSGQASPSPKPAATPDYSAAIDAAIARNPPGDYSDALAFGAIGQPTPGRSYKEPPTDIAAAAIQPVRSELRQIEEEIRIGKGTSAERQQAVVQRDKLLAELRRLESITGAQK